MRLTVLILAFACLCRPAMAADSPATVERLRCEYRENPLGISVVEPRLCWQMNDARRGAAQTAYQVLVADSPEALAADQGNLWDSGKVDSNQSIQVAYAGKPLGSRAVCHWKVRIWDAEGRPTDYGKPALWTMGLLTPEDVKAQWVGPGEPMIHPVKLAAAKEAGLDYEGCQWVWYPEPGVDVKTAVPPGARFFRKEIELPAEAKIRRARFLIAADDNGELYVNGQPAGAGFGFKASQVADVAGQLHPGQNTLAVAVTNGGENPNPAGLLGKLVIELDEGKPITVVIDTSWQSAEKPYPGWNTGKSGPSEWKPAVAFAKPGDAPWGKLTVETAEIRACPQLRKEFAVDGPIRRATVYASALGVYKLHINGKPVGNDFYTPGWTDFHKRVYYNTYDVTDMIRAGGPNAIGADLAAGWYAGAIGWKKEGHIYGELCSLFVQLEIERADGTVQTVVTDPSWKFAYGPRIEGEFLPGETYDARLRTPGWDLPGFDDAAVETRRRRRADQGEVPGLPGRDGSRDGRAADEEDHRAEAGAIRLRSGPELRRLRAAEGQGARRHEGRAPLRRDAQPRRDDLHDQPPRARCTDTYILAGDGEEIWQPQFTFHGFRYVEVTGYPGTPAADAVTGIAVNSDVPLVGSFECSSPMVNQLYSNIVWTQRANFIEVPTDCPQRDERLGWMGDAQVFVRAASYNADVAAFFTKWLVDVDDAQRADGSFTDVSPDLAGLGSGTAGWADAGVICPWTIYWVYNDRRRWPSTTPRWSA